MMDNWGYGQDETMGGMGVWGILIGLVLLVDLVLLGFWLWKQLQKK